MSIEQHMLSNKMEQFFAFSYDPLKQMLVLIVQNLQEHKEIIDKLRTSVGYDEDLMMGTEDFYNNPPLIKEPNQQNINSNGEEHNGTFQELIEDGSLEQMEGNDTFQNSARVGGQEFESNNTNNIRSAHNYDPRKQITNPILLQYQQVQYQLDQDLLKSQTSPMHEIASFDMNNKQVVQMLPSVLHTPHAPNSHNNYPTQTPRITNQKQVISEILRKLDFQEVRLSQHESMIKDMRGQLRPDSQKDQQLDIEKREQKEKFNSLAIRISSIEQLTDFLKQDQDQINTAVTTNAQTSNDNSMSKEFLQSPMKYPSEVGEQSGTIHMLQNLLLRTRKDIQDKFDSQLRNLESRVTSQLENLSNWVQQNGQMDDQEQETRFFSPRANNSIYIENNDASLIRDNSTPEVQKNKNLTGDSTSNLNTSIAQPKPKPLGMQPFNNPSTFRMPQKYITEINNLSKSSEKYDTLIKELFERWNINDRILTKINDYYESNLRIISVRSLGEQLKEFDKILESKATIIEVKKVLSAIHECNDKFNWLEEHYKQERRDQEGITNNMQAVMRNLNNKQSNLDSKIGATDKELKDFSQDLRQKIQANGFMGFGGGGSGGGTSDLLRLQVEQQEEALRQMESKFGEFQSKLNKNGQEAKDVMVYVKELLAKKVELKMLDESEDRMQKLIDKVMLNVNKRFMDKNDIKKSFQQFESQIEQIFEVLFQRVDDYDINEAMLSKKPLGGYSCISCTKKITNISGNMAEYQVNNKLPVREQSDRLHKLSSLVGNVNAIGGNAGFGKLVSNIGISHNNTLPHKFGSVESISNTASLENQRYKKFKGMFTNSNNSPVRLPIATDLAQMSMQLNQPLQDVREERGSNKNYETQQYQSQQSVNNYLLIPKLKNFKVKNGQKQHSLGQSQSVKRFNQDASEILKDLTIDTMKQIADSSTSHALGTPQTSSLPKLKGPLINI